jgi:hypothetical protein
VIEQQSLVGFDQEPTREKATCRSCGAPVFWAKTKSGKSGIFDWEAAPDGHFVLGEDGMAHYDTRAGKYVSHFSTCPDAERWRR